MSKNNNQNLQYNQLKDELVLIIDSKIQENIPIISQSNKIIEENKRIIEIFLEQKYQIDKIENLEKSSNKHNDSLISHEIKIGKIKDEISFIKTKYDKIVLDNLMVPGFIGPSCQFKNLSSYLKNNITEMGKIKLEHESMKKDTKDFKIKLDGASKNILNLIDGGIVRCNQYADNRINDFQIVLESKIKEMNDKFMEIRMKNIQYQNKIEQQINNLKNEFEEKLENQKNELIQLIDDKMEYINLNYLPLDKSPKLEEFDEIKNNYNQLEKELKEIKRILQNFKNSNNNNRFQTENKLSKFKKKNTFFKEENIFENIKNNNIINKNNSPNYNNVDDSPKKEVNFKRNKRNSVDFSFYLKKQRERNLFSPQKSKFNKNTNNLNTLNLLNTSISPKNHSSNKELNNFEENKSNTEGTDKKDGATRSISMPKKNNSKKNLINLNLKKNLIEDTNDNHSENINNINNQINIVKNNSLIKESTRKNITNENNNNIEQKDLIKIKNNNNLITNINENSHSLSSISNSSNQDNTNDENNMIINPKTILINKKNDFKSNLFEKKTFLNTNTLNKLEKQKHHFLQDKLISLKTDLSDNNESKMNSKISYNKSQGSYKNEIANELFTKYDKSTMSNNLNLIKNKAKLDLYNYSISTPDNRFLLNAKINEIIEPPAKDLFFEKKNAYEKNSGLANNKRNITLRPSLNMQLFYGNFNEKRKEKNNRKINSLSSEKHKIYNKKINLIQINKLNQ